MCNPLPFLSQLRNRDGLAKRRAMQHRLTRQLQWQSVSKKGGARHCTAHAIFSFSAFWCVAGTPLGARAQSPDTPTYRFLSGPGAAAFVGLGTLRGLLADGRHNGREESLRTGDALVSSVLLSEAIKLVVTEPRPDCSANDSFPSGHATAAFAVAAMQSRYHTKEAPLWFLEATLIGDSRVRLRKHYLHDVVAGGALGILTAEVERHQRRGLLIAPFYRPDGNVRGLTLGTRF